SIRTADIITVPQVNWQFGVGTQASTRNRAKHPEWLDAERCVPGGSPSCTFLPRAPQESPLGVATPGGSSTIRYKGERLPVRRYSCTPQRRLNVPETFLPPTPGDSGWIACGHGASAGAGRRQDHSAQTEQT